LNGQDPTEQAGVWSCLILIYWPSSLCIKQMRSSQSLISVCSFILMEIPFRWKSSSARMLCVCLSRGALCVYAFLCILPIYVCMPFCVYCACMCVVCVCLWMFYNYIIVCCLFVWVCSVILFVRVIDHWGMKLAEKPLDAKKKGMGFDWQYMDVKKKGVGFNWLQRKKV